MKIQKQTLFAWLAAAALAIIAILFFFPDDVQGNVLQQSDIQQGLANGEEALKYKAETGETTRWTNSLFGGMPNFQIAPSYAASPLMNFIAKAYQLWLPEPANLLFAMMLGFFIMCLCMKFRWQTALFGALAWGFSTYFIILIGAGHIWKFATLAYIPPTIGGLALCYRRKYLGGAALTALFGALQLKSNHPQMTYYFCFVVLAMVIAWLIDAIRQKQMRSWLIGTACIVGAGVLAVGANAAHLYSSYEYSKETIRGRATDLKTDADGKTPVSGLDKDYITAWSYGPDETFTLLIPNVKGGATIKPEAGQNRLLALDPGDAPISPEEAQFVQNFPQYFGDQPMTNGPVYVGAFVLLLAVLAMFCSPGPMRWCLFAVGVLSILLSWGHNFMPLTDLFIDHFPMYNKFRTVSSILVILEFVVPLLAVMCLHAIATDKDWWAKYSRQFYVVFGVGAFICLLGWMAPSIFGSPFSVSETEQLQQAGAFGMPEYAAALNAVRTARLGLVSADSLRSLIFIALAFAIMLLYFKGKYKQSYAMVGALAVLMLFDLYSVNKRYVNTDNFTEPVSGEEMFRMTAADQQILRDTTNYRVLDVDGFTSPRSSYFHKTIGGYHAAKLTRYNDLLERQIKKNNMGVLNMLNTKYVLSGDSVVENPDANGNAWFVDHVAYVSTPDAEMSGLDSLDTRTRAVADRKFEKVLGQARPSAPGDTIYETSYAPNRLTYKARTAAPAVAVFSEIYFPWGWEATIDGKPAEIGRADYVLRAMRIPAGQHEIVFEFRPRKVETAETLGLVSVIAIYLLLAAAGAYLVITHRPKKQPVEGE